MLGWWDLWLVDLVRKLLLTRLFRHLSSLSIGRSEQWIRLRAFSRVLLGLVRLERLLVLLYF